jgi:Tfp pilus assembly protein PilX
MLAERQTAGLRSPERTDIQHPPTMLLDHPFLLFLGIIFLTVAVLAGFSALSAKVEADSRKEMSPEELAAFDAQKKAEAASREWDANVQKYGPANTKMICPHCQKTGSVRTKKVQVQQGISGAKATGAVLTGGASILVTGLSHKVGATQAHCDNCGADWTF